MTTKKREDELEVIIQEIAQMREEIAALAASVKKNAEAQTLLFGTGEQGVTNGGREHEGWADVQRSIEEARTRGKQALNNLSVEVERHPLRSIVAAVGVGFIIAKLFGRGRSR